MCLILQQIWCLPTKLELPFNLVVLSKPLLCLQRSMKSMALASPRALYEFETFTIHAEFYALASRVWCCMSPKPSLYSHAEFYIHWLVLYGVAGHCMSPKLSLYMQSSMHWLVLYGGHCMNPKPSLYMQSSICTG